MERGRGKDNGDEEVERGEHGRRAKKKSWNKNWEEPPSPLPSPCPPQ
jgi:hypothetical protein